MEGNRPLIVCHAFVAAAMLVVPLTSWGQQGSHAAGAQEMARSNSDNQSLLNQITELRGEVAKLRDALHQADSTKRSSGGSRMKMGRGSAMERMDDQGKMNATGRRNGMGMMGEDEMMGGMSSGVSGGMGMMGESEMGGMSSGGDMSMCCMGEMGAMMGGMARPGAGMASMKASSSALPGQPGASHLYHIGSTGFFLDHAKHLGLTFEQEMNLNRLKERALLERTTAQRRIDQAEQDLYALTGADQPDPAKIQTKVAEIEKLRADQRMNLIRAVAEAAQVLTHDQHQTLLGTMTSKQQ